MSACWCGEDIDEYNRCPAAPPARPERRWLTESETSKEILVPNLSDYGLTPEDVTGRTVYFFQRNPWEPDGSAVPHFVLNADGTVARLL